MDTAISGGCNGKACFFCGRVVPVLLRFCPACGADLNAGRTIAATTIARAAPTGTRITDQLQITKLTTPLSWKGNKLSLRCQRHEIAIAVGVLIVLLLLALILLVIHSFFPVTRPMNLVNRLSIVPMVVPTLHTLRAKIRARNIMRTMGKRLFWEWGGARPCYDSRTPSLIFMLDNRQTGGSIACSPNLLQGWLSVPWWYS